MKLFRGLFLFLNGSPSLSFYFKDFSDLKVVVVRQFCATTTTNARGILNEIIWNNLKHEMDSDGSGLIEFLRFTI